MDWSAARSFTKDVFITSNRWCLAEQEIFLVALLFLCGFRRRIHFLNFGIAATGHFLVPGLHHHVTLLAQRLEIFAHRRLHLLAVQDGP